jgi:hypothetical protein
MIEENTITALHDKHLRPLFAMYNRLRRMDVYDPNRDALVDRGMVPIDCAEVSRMAIFVLASMRQKDPEQYDHFLKSVDATDPLPAEQE